MSKVWTYIINKELSPEALQRLHDQGRAFVSGWTAHENKLSARFDIFEKRIIVIQVDEQITSASGCSIDKLLRFIKDTEKNFEVTLLDRLLVAYRSVEGIQVQSASKITELLRNGSINENTLIFNSAASTGEELKMWEQPLKDTWLKKYLINV